MTATVPLKESFTSTGSKLFWHQEAMQKLRDGKGMPIVSHIMPTDVCNSRCGFCSVGERPGDVMPFDWIKGYLDQLCEHGLKAVIYSGGGNPCLWRDPSKKMDFNDLIKHTYDRGLSIGCISNGMPLKEYPCGRKSWRTVSPETLDMLTWCRISMAGIDANHSEQEVFVPDFDRTKCSLGFSWVMADLYEEPSHKHGWVSTPEDIKTEMPNRRVIYVEDRMPFIEEKIRYYVETYKPDYLRGLANCLQPDLIDRRHKLLSEMAERVNPDIVFSQWKPPAQPRVPCAKIFPHPVLNCDGFVYPCDSTVLQRTANHRFGSAWRVCRWDEIGELYKNPIRQVIPNDICPQCVFTEQVELIGAIIGGMETPAPSSEPTHSSFV